MNQSIKFVTFDAEKWRETASLLLEFNPIDTKKESLFYKKWDDKIKIIKQKCLNVEVGNGQTLYKKVIQYWRDSDSITTDLYRYLRRNYPVPIPYILFFSLENISLKNLVDRHSAKEIKRAVDLADKWLRDIFSKESFYKRNKEYFTRAEVKYFLSCDRYKCTERCCNLGDLIDYFFITKITANNLNLSLDIFQDFRNCFTHQIVIEYFKFLCNNKKYINNAEIREINEFLKNEYISTGKNINFKDYTYHSLRRLSDEWHISNVLRERFGHRYEHKIVQDYFLLICKNVKRVRDKEEEIRDVCDFLVARINNEQYFDFENMTWQELKRLSDKWLYVSSILGDYRYKNKIVHDYISFIVKEIRRVRGREEEIRDIYDFLRTEYIDNGRDFNFENMTWQELTRLSDEWHLEIRERYNRAFEENVRADRERRKKILNTEWKKSLVKDFSYEKDRKTWTIKEITTGKSLYEEGEDMNHCVFSYADDCIQGYRFIFSVRCKSGEDDSEERIATLEISSNMRLVQARGPCNDSIDNETEDIIKIWAKENRIGYGNYLDNEYDDFEEEVACGDYLDDEYDDFEEEVA